MKQIDSNNYFYLIKICILFLLFILFINIDIAQTIDTDIFWDELIKASSSSNSSNYFDKWKVIENIPIIQKQENIPTIYAASASILNYYESGKEWCGRFSYGHVDVLIALSSSLHKRNKKTNTDQELCFKKYFEQMNKLKESNSSISKRKKKNNVKWKSTDRETIGESLCKLLWQISKTEHLTIENVIHFFLKQRLYDSTVSYSYKNFEECKAIIDKALPFIIIDENSKIYLCLGYLQKDNTNFIIIGNPEVIELDIVPRASFVKIKALKRAMEKIDSNFGGLKLDYWFSLNENKKRIGEGVEILKWTNDKKIFFIDKPEVSNSNIIEFISNIN